MTDPALVAVGVDGSDCSYEALSFAVDEARRRHARLLVVTAWTVPLAAYDGAFAPGIDLSFFEAGAELIAREAVARAREAAPELEVDVRTPNEQPAEALLEAARGADLVIVGSRGHGGFASLMLGSVSQQVAQHASCPVTIVRPAG
jgi:nucleotide-binding universal stress UspA family protein